MPNPMIISFFEEFPTEENLRKLKLIDHPTKLYIAARSIREFNSISSRIKSRQVKEVIYWPVLETEEGYWISPFSKRSALKRVLMEIPKRTPVMIDAELPTTKNPWLYITQLFSFFSNRKRIRDFISDHKEVYTAEYYPSGKIKESIMSFLGIHFDPKRFGNNVIRMVYHSMHKFNRDYLVKKVKEGVDEFGASFIIGYGTIAAGILGNEPLLSRDQLEKDLKIAKEEKVSEIIIFRLGGLDKDYKKVIKRFV